MVGNLPLDDEALVVRGGLMDIPGLARAINLCDHFRHYFGLSFFGENGLTVAEIAEAAGQDRLPHERLRVSTVGRLRSLEHHPERDGVWPHLTLKFEIRPADSDLEELVSVFDADIANPLYAK